MAFTLAPRLQRYWKSSPALRLGALAALVLVLASLLWAGWNARPLGWRRSVIVRLVPPPREPGEGLSATQRQGFARMVADHLSLLRDVTILGAGDQEPAAPGLLVELDPAPRREGDLLRCSFRWRKRGEAVWRDCPAPALPPREAMAWMLAHLPFDVPGTRGDALLPENPSAFWECLDLMHLAAMERTPLHALELAREFTRSEPRCASAWRVRADLAFRRLLLQANRDGQLQEEAEDGFRRALGLEPDHPLALADHALFRSRMGDHAGSLGILASALASHPRNLPASQALAEVACRAGLGELARRAWESRKAWAGAPAGCDVAQLWMGRGGDFEAALARDPAPRSASASFYLGYARLRAGDRGAALEHFRDCAASAPDPVGVERLAQVYVLLSEDRRKEARERLAQCFDEHLLLRAPDGDCTLKLAEAAALAGEEGLAVELACRAAAQGFDCTPCYEDSPFLQSIRPRPRFQALLKTLKERQSGLEARFPSGRFGLR